MLAWVVVAVEVLAFVLDVEVEVVLCVVLAALDVLLLALAPRRLVWERCGAEETVTVRVCEPQAEIATPAAAAAASAIAALSGP